MQKTQLFTVIGCDKDIPRTFAELLKYASQPMSVLELTNVRNTE